MSQGRNELYKWEKVSKPRVYSRSQRVTSNDDIHDWIKKVEDASGRAAAATFGTKYAQSPGYVKRDIASTVDDVHIHDAAYVEAQELLQQWMNDKVDLSGDVEPDLEDDVWAKKTKSEIRKEWDHLLGVDDDDEPVHAVTQSKTSARDPYQILHADDDRLVDEVLQNLMDKHVIGDNMIQDLGLDKHDKYTDPRTKMHLRQQQVKENREKRERDKQKKLHEQRSKKDTQLQARQIVLKEDQKKALQKKREEEAIQQDMARIRKEMMEERHLQQEEKNRQQREKEELARNVQEVMEREQEQRTAKQIKKSQHEQETQKHVMERLKELEQHEITENLRLMHRCLSAWYKLVIQRHLREGKAKATSDWKLLLRTFNAWKSFARSRQIDRETQIYEDDLKQLKRKQVLAEDHHRKRLLRKCFIAWQLYLVQQQNQQMMTTVQNQTKNKMAAFLDAAATGKLWSARSEDDNKSVGSQKVTSSTGRDTARQVDDMFSGPGRQVVPSSARSDSTDMSTSRTPGGKGKNQQRPKQAWQLSRKDVEVTKEELAIHIKKQDPRETPGLQSDRTDASHNKSHHKTLYVVNNFEHRHAAQQHLLETQQKQIKEQQRLIEDMHFLQKQQILQQQLTQQQMLHKQLDDATGLKQDLLKLQKQTNNTTDQVKSVKQDRQSANAMKKGQHIGAGDLNIEDVDLNIEDVEAMNGHVELNDGGDGSVTERSNVTETSSATCEADNKSAVSSNISNVSMLSGTSKHSTFLKSMEGRASERARLKKEREDKRRKLEEERLAKLQAEDAERLKQEEDEKRKKIEAYREKKLFEKQKEQEKQQQLERIKQLTAVAEEHSRLGVLKYRGWLPWRCLVTMAHDNFDKATNHYKQTVLRKVLMSWHTVTQEDLTHKRGLADHMHQYILYKRCFQHWQMLGHHTSILEEKAVRHYEKNLKVKVIQAWIDYATEEKMAGWRKGRQAKEHNQRRMLLTPFRAWKRFPDVIREDEVRQKRLQDMRSKVASLLPDFQGSSSTNKSTDFFS